MISLHKWYPFVFPKEYDVRQIAFEKRVQRLELEHNLEVKYQKVREAVEAYDLELYNKRAREHTVELEMFSNRKRVDVSV
jgi:predicted nucleotidyltransferase